MIERQEIEAEARQRERYPRTNDLLNRLWAAHERAEGARLHLIETLILYLSADLRHDLPAEAVAQIERIVAGCKEEVGRKT